MAAEDDADGGAFNLGGDSASFQSKKMDIFGSLDVLEKSYQSKVAARLETDNTRESNSEEARNGCDRMEDDENRQFKRPLSPKEKVRRNDFRSKAWSRRGDFSPNRNRKADFEVNPEKWKKYSLEDTTVCGNAQNSRVAFDLIRQLRQRREETEGLGEGSQKADLDQKIVFSKPKTTSVVSDTEKQPSSFGSVHRMQEFNFGKKDSRLGSKGPTKENRNKSDNVSVGNSLSLEHLDDELEEDSNIMDESEKRLEPLDQSGERSEKRDHSGFSKGGGTVTVREETESEDVPASISFKKRKAKRNIRGRRDEDTD